MWYLFTIESNIYTVIIIVYTYTNYVSVSWIIYNIWESVNLLKLEILLPIDTIVHVLKVKMNNNSTPNFKTGFLR